MKISEIDQLQVGSLFKYKGFPAFVKTKREKNDKLSVGRDEKGNDLPDKSVCINFSVDYSGGNWKDVTLVSRLDSKCVKNGALYELELEDYEN